MSSIVRYDKTLKEAPMTSQAPMYFFATERVGEYYSKIDLKDKKVLTICGSGDQVLNAFLVGAKQVIGFDLNKRSEFITRLKIVAIKNLNYQEFISFFGFGRRAFDYNTYSNLRNNLNKRSKIFFDKIYKEFENNGYKLSKSEYFRQRKHVISGSEKRINLYLKNERHYEKLKKIMSKKKFIFLLADLENLATNKSLAKERFDLINLSNAQNYFSGRLRSQGFNAKASVRKIFKEILLPLRGLLTKKGHIMFYSYSPKVYPNQIAKKIPPPSRNYYLNKMKRELSIKIIQKNFEGITPKTQDKIVLIGK